MLKSVKSIFFAGMISEPANSRAGIKNQIQTTTQQKGGIEEGKSSAKRLLHR